jgi:hypothetical protein
MVEGKEEGGGGGGRKRREEEEMFKHKSVVKESRSS